MKYKSLLISTAVLLFGCQSTFNQSNVDQPLTNQPQQIISDNTPIDNASTDIASAIEKNKKSNKNKSTNKATDVIHPIADVNVDLGKKAEQTSLNNNIWQRIRSQLTFNIPENQRLTQHRKTFLKHPNYILKVTKRAEPFLYYIVEELEAHNIPIEIALLPIVESAFDPFAYSHGRASGMWQFVPATGKRYGMKQNWWYDGRRDIVASTQGAIAYLTYLHKFFNGDWLLALAAYNSGEGRVRRAVRANKKKNLPTDFWSLNLPKETRDYVPKLLALADIIKRNKALKIPLHNIENKAVVTQVNIGSQLDLAKAAQLAELSLNQLQRLNPGFNRWATAPNGPHRLLLPINKVDSFQNKLTKLTSKDRLAWQRYKIKRGDNLGKIAQAFNTKIDLIKQVNNIQGNRIRAGKFLLIPVASASLESYSLSKDQRIARQQNRNLVGKKQIHIVKAGDTLWDLGQRYKVSTKSIASANGMVSRDTIKPGQKLVIWQKNTPQASSKNKSLLNKPAIIRNITYKVKKGDSFARIANKFNIKIADIERWNTIKRSKYLQPGQKLKLSVDITNNI